MGRPFDPSVHWTGMVDEPEDEEDGLWERIQHFQGLSSDINLNPKNVGQLAFHLLPSVDVADVAEWILLIEQRQCGRTKKK